MATAFDWNELLKPSREKYLAAVFLFLVFVPCLEYDNGIRCIRAPCPANNIGSLLMFFLFSPTHDIFQILYINAIVGLALAYILAAIAVPLYSKAGKPMQKSQ